FKAAVIGTTGWNDIQNEVIEYFTNAGTTLIYASNFSIGVNILFAAADFISRKMAASNAIYSPYIVEMHHCHKLDAPSGTAKSLADIVEGNLGGHIDISSVRCGEISGIHTIGFEGPVDRITLSHEAFSRAGFARGAVEAAVRADKLHGVYEFKDIIFE
ncbi:MAG: 4-hydroxy-tetrahydrodipicolinate reductase, partial [Bacteroidales bacterium]|nr:4-hydroxy-tetrahydrodipicolinate reductase [Bacteroidales bacterium]